ncbi:hypothetical protein [Aquimarina mytili]|uniref:Uncharacterized protein n=1 Tax=Aquimarina mytili TaxID=874423 RepID=A0A936ZTB6_9FLAO|nr:hypothetical protein [Aquimarina mytili]MBL0684303.1 hypothetical protein [Aquimarina mytili]
MDRIKTKKYKILECLKKLPYEEYRIAKKNLPFALEVSKRTFERWLYLETGSKMQIPADKLAIVSNYLGLESMDELINYEVPQYTTTKLKKLEYEEDINLINELNLIQ